MEVGVGSRIEHKATPATGCHIRLVPSRAEKGNPMINASIDISTSGLLN